jgi:hypothetical protein
MPWVPEWRQRWNASAPPEDPERIWRQRASVNEAVHAIGGVRAPGTMALYAVIRRVRMTAF